MNNTSPQLGFIAFTKEGNISGIDKLMLSGDNRIDIISSRTIIRNFLISDAQSVRVVMDNSNEYLFNSKNIKFFEQFMGSKIKLKTMEPNAISA